MVELSSLDVSHLAAELAVLEDAFVDKVYQTAPDAFLFNLRHRDRGRFHLVVHPGAYAALASDAPDTPQSPSQQAMALRKGLANARVRRVRQHEFDRVLVLDLERGGETSTLIFEFFGKGNVVLVDASGVIRHVWRSETFRHRIVRIGQEYRFPPARPHPSQITTENLDERARASKRDLVRFLAVELGLGGDLAEATVAASGLAKDAAAAGLSTPELDSVLAVLRKLLLQPVQPRVVVGTEQVRLELLSTPRDDEHVFDSMSAAIVAAARQQVEAAPERPDEELQRLLRQRRHQEEAIERVRAEADQVAAAAESVFARYGDLQSLIARIAQAVRRTGWAGLATQAAQPEHWPEVKSVDPKRKRVRIDWDGVALDIDPDASVETNASSAFDRVKAARAKVEGARAALEQTQMLIGRREKAIQRSAREETVENTLSRRTYWFMAYRWFFTTNGLLVLAGRDAATNEKLVKKHMKPGDRYCHADVHGAASVVLKGRSEAGSDQDARQACQFAAIHSKAFAQFATGDAYWVLPEQVSKTAQSGEFVPKGAFIVRGTRTYERDLPMEVGIGIVALDAHGALAAGSEGTTHRHLMCGPWEAVRLHCPGALRVARGQEKATTVANAVARALSVPADAVARALPAGTLQLKEASS